MNWGLALGIVLIFVGLFWILLELLGSTKVDDTDQLEELRKAQTALRQTINELNKDIQELKRELENKQ